MTRRDNQHPKHLLRATPKAAILNPLRHTITIQIDAQFSSRLSRYNPVHLVTTPCHMGGKRHWFLCPARGCGKRAAVLYGGGIFACRKCYQLAYPSQRESTEDRATRRADRIRDRLGWPGGILEGAGWGKPKGMHWRTYERLSDKHDTFTNTVNLAFIARFGASWEKGGF